MNHEQRSVAFFQTKSEGLVLIFRSPDVVACSCGTATPHSFCPDG